MGPAGIALRENSSRRIYPERLSGISSYKRNNLTMTRRLLEGDLDT